MSATLERGARECVSRDWIGLGGQENVPASLVKRMSCLNVIAALVGFARGRGQFEGAWEGILMD